MTHGARTKPPASEFTPSSSGALGQARGTQWDSLQTLPFNVSKPPGREGHAASPWEESLQPKEQQVQEDGHVRSHLLGSRT